MFATTQCPGLDFGFPDICRTPVPVPFPNMGIPTMGFPAAYNIFTDFMPTHNIVTEILPTLGDQPGVLGGVVSQVEMGPSRRIVSSFTVLTDGMPTNRLTSFGIHNLINCPGMTLVPSQPTVIVLAP